MPYGVLGGAKVMFQRIAGVGGEISAVYLIDAAGDSSAILLDTLESLLFGPVISPAGDRIALLAWGSSCYDVQVRGLDGSLAGQSSFPCNDESPPSWSPDGQVLVFGVGFVGEPDWGVYAYRPASESTTALRLFDHPWASVPTSPPAPSTSRQPAAWRGRAFARSTG